MRLGAAIVGGAAIAGACAQLEGLGSYNKVGDFDSGAVTPVDGGPDTAPPPCLHTFCADFDHSTNVSDGWQNEGQSPGTTLDLDRQTFQTPPASMVASVPLGAGGLQVANVSEKFLSPPRTAHLHFYMRAASMPPAPDASGSSIELVSLKGSDFESGTGGGVSIDLKNGAVELLVQTVGDSGIVDDATPFTLTTGKFVSVALDVVFSSTGGGSVTLSLDGAPAVSKSNLTTATAGAGSTTLTLGLTTNGSTPPLQLNYDDLTLDLQ
jgi:hypothetical protein